MTDVLWRKVLAAAQDAARAASPDGWTPSPVVVAAAVTAALKTIREATDV